MSELAYKIHSEIILDENLNPYPEHLRFDVRDSKLFVACNVCFSLYDETYFSAKSSYLTGLYAVVSINDQGVQKLERRQHNYNQIRFKFLKLCQHLYYRLYASDILG